MDANKEEFEATCNLFINAIKNYFNHMTEINSEVSVPYLKNSEKLVLKDYTGMIGISGTRKGFVYISADQEMYKDLIYIFIGIDNPSKEDVLDMAGEISNVIAGSVRADYGNNFNISVPVVFEGKPKGLDFTVENSSYVIPIQWKNHEAYVVVGLSE